MTKQFSILLIYCFLLNLPVFSQNEKWSLQFNHIASDKGLSELTNHFVFNDSKGFTWISSIEGLNRFDGRRVKVYKSNTNDTHSLLDDNIQSPFFEDNNSDIWFTTINGINCYKRQNDNFERFTIQQDNSVPLNEGYIAIFLEQNRWLWIQKGGRLYKFDTKSQQQTKYEFLHNLDGVRFAIDTFPSGKVHCLVACFWIAKEGIEILQYDENARVISRQSLFARGQVHYPPLTVRQAVIENDTTVWLSASPLIIKFNPKKTLGFEPKKLHPNGTVARNLALDNSNNLWVSANQTPLFIFNKKSNQFESQNLYFSEFSNIIYEAAQLYIDLSSNIWVSTSKKGVFHSRLKSLIFSNPIQKTNQFSHNIKLPYSVEKIVEDKNGQIWLSYTNAIISNSGYFHFDKNKFSIKQQEPIPKSSKFIQTKNGQFWCDKHKNSIELYDFAKSKFEIKLKDTLLDIRDFIEIDDSTLLIGSTQGLIYFDTKKYTQKKDSSYGIPWALHKIGNHIWYTTSDGKIVCAKLNKNRLGFIVKELPSYVEINNFFSSKYTPLVLWVATAKGIVKINTETLTDTLFTEKDGLPSNYIQAVLEDKQGNLWCSTNQGIFKYNPHIKQSKFYTKRHGLSSDSYNCGAALLSSTGEMWFGGNNGVDVFYPDSIRDIGHAPQSAIVGLKIFDKYWKGETAIEVAEHITLKHNENTLTLELAAMEYTDPENNRYKVALVAEGDTIQWTDLGTQNYVTYPNMREGKYTFMLLTANTEGIWNEIPKILAIEIKPPYWRTWWFLTLVALATMALVGYIVYLRLSKVIELQKIRLNLYENLHDDIGARLTAIVLIVDELKGKGLSKEPKLEKAGTISRNIVANMRRLVWATAPENDALATVAQQMQTDRKLLLPTDTKFTLKVDKALESTSIGGDKRYQMLSIFNEALTNIAKYAEATSVETAIEIKDETLSMTIVDNGKGFDPEAPRADGTMSSGHGLRNMQRRANRINGELTISSKLGDGTSVVFSFSMKEDSVWTKFLSVFSKKSPK